MISQERIGYTILVIMFAAGVGIIVVRNLMKKKAVTENAAYTTARLIDYTPTGKGSGGGFDYRYVVSGTKYIGHRSYPSISWKMGDVFLNKEFPIVYNSKEPSQSYLLLLPGDFAEFGLEYPDSLQWVVKTIP